jgi:hypothetical protein
MDTTAQLRLYNLNDDGDGDLLGDETTWDAIWAPDLATAERIFRERYERETGVKPGGSSLASIPSAATASRTRRWSPRS